MRVYGERIGKLIQTTKVGELEIFEAFVVEGFENFNMKHVFMASVRSLGSSENGLFYDNFNQARNEALEILRDKNNKFQEEMKKYNL